MTTAETLMKQAWMTSEEWMTRARKYVDENFSDYPPAARAQLIAAYVNAAAGDEIAMHVRMLAKAGDGISSELKEITSEVHGVAAALP